MLGHGPAQNRVPCRRLSRNQPGRIFGPVANKVGRGIFDDIVRNVRFPLRDGVDGGVREFRQRQARGHDGLALRVPFAAMASASPRAARQRFTGRGLDLTAVEQHANPPSSRSAAAADL